MSTWISELSRQLAIPRRRHRAAHDHASAAHDDDAGRGADRRRRGVLLRAPAAPGEHRRAGPRRRSDGHGRRGVLADPHGAELHARGRRDAPLRRAVGRRRRRRRSRARCARVLRRRHLRRLRGRGRGALAGRPPRAAGVLTAGALVEFLFYAFTVAAAVGALASLFGSYQEAVGAAQRVFELLDTSRRSRSRCPPPLPQAGARRGAARAVPSATRPSSPTCCRRVLLDRARRSRGARRPVRRGEDDGRVAAPALLGRDRGSHHARRHRRSRPLARRPSRRDRHRAAGARAVQRHGARQHRLRARRTRRRSRSSPPRAPRTRWSSSSGCRMASTRASASAA